MTDRPCRTELLNHINAVSFAVDEVKLYLDTTRRIRMHWLISKIQPDAQPGNERICMNFGPLTIDTATASCSEYWKWINEPWPWQEGGC